MSKPISILLHQMRQVIQSVLRSRPASRGPAFTCVTAPAKQITTTRCSHFICWLPYRLAAARSCVTGIQLLEP